MSGFSRQVARASWYREAVPRSSRPYRDERVSRRSGGPRIWYGKLCPVHRGLIAMSGSSRGQRGPRIMVSEAVPRSSRPYRDERVFSRQVARASWYRKLCPVHRGLIAMSGSLEAGGPLILVSEAVPRSSRPYRDERVFSEAGGPLILVSGAVPRSSRPYRDERVLGQGPSGVTIAPCHTA